MNTRNVLGKGLSALLPPSDVMDLGGMFHCPIEKLYPNPRQPRKDFENLDELAASIREKGLLQPLIVRRTERGYEVLAGERRLRAAQQLKLTTLPVIVRDSEDQEALEISLIENLQREDLNPMEEAEAFQLLMEQFSQTQEALATRLGKDRSTLANTLRLLRLPSEIRDMVRGGSLSAGHARSLLSLATPEEQLVLAREILEQGLSVRQVEDLVKRRKAEEPGAEPKAKPEPKTKPREEFYLSLERSLGDHLGTGVAINERRRRIVIDYLDEADLQRILGRLAPTPPTA
ncbi:MAG: hypothetical protein A2284_04395 [Deltaproteobacteria bacterium RIFOXYA12_FULL_61_11]|nr:MAG: hypothetical protein A2284_04395 [Deltaproteobacteria bacterium RIFOXYA12_FULL_61_11]